MNRLVSSKVRSRVTQRCPRRVFLAEQRVRCIPPVCGGPVLFVAEGYPVVRKSISTEQTRDKVKRRFTLSVTAESWWDDRAGGHRLWLWGWTWLLSSTATHLNKDNDHGCSERKYLKCLTDSADDLRGRWLVRTNSTWDYGVGPLRCGLVRELLRHQHYLGLIAGLGPPYSSSGRWVCFTGQPRTVLEYKGQGSKVPLYLGLDQRWPLC